MTKLETYVSKNKIPSLGYMMKLAGKNLISSSPLSMLSTTKHSPLPLNARILIRSVLYPKWEFNSNDFKDKEKGILYDLATLSAIRQKERGTSNNYIVEREVLKNPSLYKDNKYYKIKPWNNQLVSGKDLKEVAKDLASNGIAFHDYDSLVSMMDIDNRGNKTRRYSDKQINQMQNFSKDNLLKMMYHSFTNPVYAVRTGIGRADMIPLGNHYDNGSRSNYILNDTFDFEKINKNDFDMSNDYNKLHKFAEKNTYPLNVKLNLGF